MTRIHEVNELGQSIWYDNVRRAMLDSGEMSGLIEKGVSGVTSNPSIFEKAIAGSADYDRELRFLTEQGRQPLEIFEMLAVEDIKRTADLLCPVYERSGSRDGFVSLEIDPRLASNTEGTITEARRLFDLLARPNVMIKVPATQQGIPAIEELISQGININITLMFSLNHYKAVVNAYIQGLEKLLDSGNDISQVSSAASFFISRVDSAVDPKLEAVGAADLKGKIGIANAKLVYSYFQELFNSERWQKLAERGANVQRLLWASTSAKNPEYPDTLYVDALIGPDTVNTLPPSTLIAFLDHGKATTMLTRDIEQARMQLERLKSLGINLDEITQSLQSDGVDAFAKSFSSLLSSIRKKQHKLDSGWRPLTASLGRYIPPVENALDEMQKDSILERIWSHDHTIWKPEPEEISNRLGWLNIVEIMRAQLPRLKTFVSSVRQEGYEHALLLGMGGSSLAPDVFRRMFSTREGYPVLDVLDSTNPDEILGYAEKLDIEKTLFIVSTKSGTTIETLSLFKYFYNHARDELGPERAGECFIAVTDPGTKLVELANDLDFREIFLNDPNIGGRYSALSYFGIVPAALMGIDIEALLDHAQRMQCNCDSCNEPHRGDNLGAVLGAILGELAKIGKNKLTLITSPSFDSFADWIEQLIAESTGKEGRGILPVVGEPLGSPSDYGDDRLFVYLRMEGEGVHDHAVDELEYAGQPVVRIHLENLRDLGGQYFLWELATAVAGHRLEINPFDQPNVEAAKVRAREMMATYEEKGELPDNESAPVGIDTLQSFIADADPKGYIALQVYAQETPEVNAALQELRSKLRAKTGLATTAGYGPRYLHSTGQLHKGDAGRGMFIQFISDHQHDIPIPEIAGSSKSSISFGVLIRAQALGDRKALLDAGRQVLSFKTDPKLIIDLRTLTDN